MTMYNLFKWYEGTGQESAAKSIMVSIIKHAVKAAKDGQLQNVYTYLEKFDTAITMYIACIDSKTASETYRMRHKVKELVWDVYYYHKNKVPV